MPPPTSTASAGDAQLEAAGEQGPDRAGRARTGRRAISIAASASRAIGCAELGVHLEMAALLQRDDRAGDIDPGGDRGGERRPDMGRAARSG